MKTHLDPPSRDFNAGEFALVIALAFGLPIAGSLSAAFSYSDRPLEFGDTQLLWTVGYELVVGGVIWVVLRSRGWRPGDFAIHSSSGSTIFGVALAALVLALWWAFEAVVGKVPVELSAGIASIVAISVVNPLFEELLVLAYVVQAMRKRFGLTTAMNVSLAIRLLYHLYEGPLAVIPMAVFGLVATLVFVRMGRLWPVIVMHAVMDFVGLTVS